MEEVTNILAPQAEFITSTYRHTGLIGGYGSGKTFVGVTKSIIKHRQYSTDVAYYLPTYPLIRDISFPKFEEILTNYGITYVLNKSDKTIITPYGTIFLRSMDNPDLIVGYEVGYSLIDEADVLSTNKMKDVFVKVIGRNRSVLPNDEPNQLDFVSTPEGYKFLHDFFITKASDNKLLIKVSTLNNPYVSDSYIESLLESYTPQQIQAYIDGEFVNMNSGNVYHMFDRKRNHSNREIKLKETLHVGMDFNITNMSAVIHVTDGKIVTAVGEVTKGYDTAEMITTLKERFKGHRIVVYPDASGDARNTAGESDIKLLRKAGFNVRVRSKNPSVRDRITTVNVSLLNAKDQTTYYINTNNCIEYTDALEKMPYKNGRPDKESGFDHITDAGGYCLYQIKNSNQTISIHV
tara:strand:- start:994 stop:2214 length:1221 start_codon:yes stop_codon:yes gene_type:complete